MAWQSETETDSRSVSNRMNNPGQLAPLPIMLDDCRRGPYNNGKELKIGWERKIVSGIPLVGEKDLQPSETKNEWTTEVGIIWLHGMGWTLLRNSEMSYFSKAVSTEQRQIVANKWMSPLSWCLTNFCVKLPLGTNTTKNVKSRWRGWIKEKQS